MKASFDHFPGPDTTEGSPQVVSGAPGRGWRTWVIAVANALVRAGCRSTSVGGGEGSRPACSALSQTARGFAVDRTEQRVPNAAHFTGGSKMALPPTAAQERGCSARPVTVGAS